MDLIYLFIRLILHRISQRELAEMLEVSKTSLNRIFQGIGSIGELDKVKLKNTCHELSLPMDLSHESSLQLSIPEHLLNHKYVFIEKLISSFKGTSYEYMFHMQIIRTLILDSSSYDYDPESKEVNFHLNPTITILAKKKLSEFTDLVQSSRKKLVYNYWIRHNYETIAILEAVHAKKLTKTYR